MNSLNTLNQLKTVYDHCSSPERQMKVKKRNHSNRRKLSSIDFLFFDRKKRRTLNFLFSSFSLQQSIWLNKKQMYEWQRLKLNILVCIVLLMVVIVKVSCVCTKKKNSNQHVKRNACNNFSRHLTFSPLSNHRLTSLHRLENLSTNNKRVCAYVLIIVQQR